MVLLDVGHNTPHQSQHPPRTPPETESLLNLTDISRKNMCDFMNTKLKLFKMRVTWSCLLWDSPYIISKHFFETVRFVPKQHLTP